MNRTKQTTLVAILMLLTGLLMIISAIPAIMNEAALSSTGADTPGYLFLSLALILGSLSLAAAYGLWKNQRWAKILAIVIQAVNGLFSLPGVLFAPDTVSQISAIVGVALAVVIIVLLLWRTPKPTMA